MIEAAIHIIIIYTNHSITITIIKQINLNITSIEKLNLRLIHISKYLQRFRLNIRYKLEKSNMILDALSKLINREYRFEKKEFIE